MQAIDLFSARPASLRRDSIRDCALPLLFVALLAFATTISAQTLKIGGNGSGMPAMQLLGAEFARRTPGVTVVVVPNLGSSGGLKALRDGVIDLAISARPLKPEETAQGLVATEYGRTPFVFATNSSVTQGFGSLPQLIDAYAGKLTTWPDGKPIRLILRPKNDGDTALQQAISPEMKQAVDAALARPGMIIASTDQDASEMLEKTAGALGVTSMSMIQTEKRSLNLLSINGVAPSTKALGDGSYRYVKTMYRVRIGAGTDAVMRFHAFVASREGRQLLVNSGYWVAGGN